MDKYTRTSLAFAACSGKASDFLRCGMRVRDMPKPRWMLTFYKARVRVVTRRDCYGKTTNVFPIEFNSLSHSRWEIYSDCKSVAMMLYPETRENEFEIVEIAEVK